MKTFSLSVFVTSLIALLVATQNAFPEQHSLVAIAADLPCTGDLVNAYKCFKKTGSEKTFLSLLNQYKSDIITHRPNDEKKLNEMVQVFLFSLNSCDETLPTALAEIFSYRIDLFPDSMKRIPDKQKSEFLHILAIGVANIEFEATKRDVSKADAERVSKFKARFSEYQKTYPYTK